jgi:ubiquinone/menaquinone biosynthesis C-methylase UbiE
VRQVTDKNASVQLDDYVPETRFGKWFIGTDLWTSRVLAYAFKDFDRLIKNRKKSYPVIIDIGCGWGSSFKFLSEHFSPNLILANDINPQMIHASKKNAAKQMIKVEFFHDNCCQLSPEDQSVDIVFCHQTFHHLVEQEKSIQEFYRILKPGGLLLFGESTRAYIYSWIIRLLFRHPMEVQKSAPEYIAMIKNAGFDILPESVSCPYLWWSRSDFGIMENWFGRTPSPAHEETLINLVAVRPENETSV